ncbi:MAG: CPBP family intramembrane metalloprotease, partial [Gemmatimonadetes bacterium]|nr:CPBP family intramembrane metalloprotease [Gemmatimonadota bacterium]
RADHTFTWKLRGFDVEGASYRLRIAVHGDQIGGFSEFLKVPEAWERDYEELRSHNLATGLIASFFLVLTLLAMLVVFFVNIRQRDIRWKTAVIFGGIAFVLTLLANLNNLPVTEYAYETTETYGSYLTNQLLVSLLSALAQGLFILFLTAAAEPVYRRAYGDQIRLNEQFQPHGMRTKRFLLGTVLGLTMTAFFFAYQTIFYLIAEKFGAWSPAQIPYDEMVNTYIPWIMVLLIGFLPAVSEEFISRAFSIPFLQRYLKSRWAAVVISALIWGFAHATYPQQPFFIRGLEVGIAGIIIGAVMLRWGILAPLVWHYTVDALYTALILLRSSNSYFVISAALSAGILLLPLLVATLIYLRRRFFVDPTSMLNRADSPPLASEQAPEAGELLPPEAQLLRELPDSVLANYRPLSGSRLGLAAVIVAVFASLLFLEVERPLQQVDFALTSDEARQKAIEHLQASGTQPDTFHVAVFQQHQPDGDAIKYILERASIDRVNQYYTQDLRASLWMVRFFRPLQKEEFWVEVDPQNGEIYSVRHLLDEDAPGADLEEEEARIIAEEHMRAYGLDPDAFELKQSSSEKLDARRDHRFIWEAREGDPRNLDELHFRCEVRIAGDQPVALRRHFKLPEAWQRERDESTTLQATLGGLRIALIVAVALHLLYLLIRQVRSGGISWLSLIKIGTLAGLVVMLGFLNSLP